VTHQQNSSVFRVAILDLYDGVPNEGMRCIKALINEFQIKKNLVSGYTIFDVRKGVDLPEPEEYDVYISSGGPGSPLLEGHEWERKYFKLIESLIEHNNKNENKIHLLAICHSFQLLMQYFDLSVINKRKSTSFGVMPVHKTDDGTHEWIFNGLKKTFFAVDSRDYQAIEPNWEKIQKLGAKVLCLEKERPHVPLEQAIMAVRFTPEIIGTQFHPEADAEGMHRYFLDEEKKALVIKNHGSKKYYSMLEHLEDPDKIMYTESIVIPKLLEKALKNIEESVIF
jgi:GMP synthase-like glutamine amidotransferase